MSTGIPQIVRQAVSETHWASLKFYCIYRVCIAAILLVSALLAPSSLSIVSTQNGETSWILCSMYLLLATVTLSVAHRCRYRFNLQLTLQVFLDLLVLTMLMHAGGGLRSGLAVLILIALAGAGLVGEGRLVVFYAAVATVLVLLERVFHAFANGFEVVDFFQIGLFCIGFFTVAIVARLLARRVVANEELARRRGVDLRNQILISQRAIEEMQDGVLVVDRTGRVKQHNPRVEQLLGLGDAAERRLDGYSTELARRFLEWCERPGYDPMLVRAPASGKQLRARFVSTQSSENDVLIFLEDMGRVQEQARQIKLAALGRLTANIAHEIRNPLSAINHAGELLGEEVHDPGNARLLRIVLDNARRVERIVGDVLELGRRDRAHPERIDLRQTLPALIDEYVLKEKLESGVVALDIGGIGALVFDRSHFFQVMWNLLGNALRHSRRVIGSVRVMVRDEYSDGCVRLCVVDDGDGVSEENREQVFEPFFTTHSRGTGLGLYIARELCEANGAQLELMPYEAGQGAKFCLFGRGVE